MKQSDIEKEIRRIQSIEYTIDDKNFVMKNKSNVLTNMCCDDTPLHSSKDDIKRLFNIVENHDVKIKSMLFTMAIGALLYIIEPIDIVPDFIPLAGLLDDICVLRTIMKSITK